MVVILTGKNEHKIQQKLKEIIDKYISSNGSSIEHFDCEELASPYKLIDAVRSVSLFDQEKIVVAKNFSVNKDIFENIQRLVDQTSDATTLVLVDSNLDKRSKQYRYLNKLDGFYEYNEEQPVELVNWVIKEANKYEATINMTDARYLVERVGTNQQLLHQEIKKLSLHTESISRETIDDLVEQTPNSKVFDMLERLFSGQGEEAWGLYIDQLKQGEEPQKIIGMIVWQLQQLTYAVYSDCNKAIMIEAGVSPYSAQKTINLARKINKKQLKMFINRLTEIDYSSKTNSDLESAVSLYFTEVVTAQTTS